MHLTHQRTIGADQQLLTRLPTCVKRPGNLGSPKRAGLESSAVVPREGDALGNALVDNCAADLSQAIDIRFPRAEISALDGVKEQAIDAVIVVRVVLGGVNAALGGNAVRTAGTVMQTETAYVI